MIAVLFSLLAAYFYKPSSSSDGGKQKDDWNEKQSDESVLSVSEITENDETFETKF